MVLVLVVIVVVVAVSQIIPLEAVQFVNIVTQQLQDFALGLCLIADAVLAQESAWGELVFVTFPIRVVTSSRYYLKVSYLIS